jgi:hypothetical protein
VSGIDNEKSASCNDGAADADFCQITQPAIPTTTKIAHKIRFDDGMPTPRILRAIPESFKTGDSKVSIFDNPARARQFRAAILQS